MHLNVKTHIPFEMDEDGICSTTCPYRKDERLKVNSSACSDCIHNFGLFKDSDRILKCTGHRI